MNLLNIDTLWFELCEDVWDKHMVIDSDDLSISLTSVIRWFSKRGYKISNGDSMVITERLMVMLSNGDFHHQRYGDTPEIHLESLEVPVEILQKDLDTLRSMTPSILQGAGLEAGFDLDVWGTKGNHPLDKWDY